MMMSNEQLLRQRANACELCSSSHELSAYAVPPDSDGSPDESVLVCETCLAQLEKRVSLDDAHWGGLTTSMWSEVPAVQVVSWRMLQRLRHQTWAQDALDMMYMDDDRMEWAKKTGDHEGSAEVEFHRDCNGARLENGDNVVLIKTLDVKGSSANARNGTVVRSIRLVHDNIHQIEGKIDGQQIVILTQYVRKGS